MTTNEKRGVNRASFHPDTEEDTRSWTGSVVAEPPIKTTAGPCWPCRLSTRASNIRGASLVPRRRPARPKAHQRCTTTSTPWQPFWRCASSTEATTTPVRRAWPIRPSRGGNDLAAFRWTRRCREWSGPASLRTPRNALVWWSMRRRGLVLPGQTLSSRRACRRLVGPPTCVEGGAGLSCKIWVQLLRSTLCCLCGGTLMFKRKIVSEMTAVEKSYILFLS